MTSQELAQHTSKVLSKLISASAISLSPDVFDKLQALDRTKTRKEWNRTLYTAKDGADFRLPLNISSVPYITRIDRGKVQLTTIEPKFFKLKSKEESASPKMKGTRLTDFKGAIEHINRISFRNGINLDSFKVLNIGHDPINREQMKFLLDRGGIIPLSHDSGLYIPNYAQNGNYYSFEYEGRFRGITALRGSAGHTFPEDFEKLVDKPVRNTFGFNIASLFPYDITHQFSYDCHEDSTIEARPNRVKGEVVLGTGPMSNMLYAGHLVMESWKARDMIHPKDFIMDKSSGLHISTNMYNKGSVSNRTISAFLNHVGLIFATLGRTQERWKSSGSFLGPERTYGSRRDFRIVDDRLEARYPGSVLDIGYLANQMTMVGKLSNDLQLYMKQYGQEPEPNYDFSVGHWLSSQSSRAHISTDLHGAGNTANGRMMKQWFDSFTNAIGITDPFDKELLLKFNRACENTVAPSEY